MDESKVKEDDIYMVHGPISKVPLPDVSLGRFIHGMLTEAPKDSIAMIDAMTNEAISHTEFLQKSVNLAQALRIQGYQGQNTILSICSENSIHFFIPILASLFNGAIIAPLNPAYTAHELKHALSITCPKIVFVSEACALKVCDLRQRDPSMAFIELVIVLKNNSASLPANTQTLDHFIQGSLGNRNVNVREFQPENGDISKMAAFILCSSGTTGLPKGVVQTHMNSMVRMAHGRDPQFYMDDPKLRLLGLLPFFHTFGLHFTLSTISNLQTVVCLKRFEEDLFLKTIEKYRVNIVTLVPPLASFIAKSDKIFKYDLSSIRDVLSGAAILDKDTEEIVKKRLKVWTLRQGLGMTETATATALIGLKDNQPGSTGKIVTFTSGKVRDPETGKSLGPGKVGELCWKGPPVMPGYYKNETATKEAFTPDGWYRSGDLGYYDQEGFFYVIDRLKEIIKYKGYQVAPAELEALLTNHPEIEDVGVIGKPDEAVGELPLAFVVKKQGSNIKEEEIQKYVADLVSPQKRLRGGVIFVDQIPKNPSGKILRRLLRESLKRQSTLKSKL